MPAGHVSRLYVYIYICIYMLYHARVHVPCSSVVSQTCMKGGGGGGARGGGGGTHSSCYERRS